MPASAPDRAGLVPVAVGLAGSVVVALAGPSAGVVPRALDPFGRPVPLGRTPGSLLCLLGVAVLVLGWGLLGRALPRVGPRTVVLATALWSLPLLAGPPLMTRDVYSYVGQGALVRAGLDPFQVGPGALTGPLVAAVDPRWLSTPAPYGPLFLWLTGRSVDITGGSVRASVLLLRLLTVLGLPLLAWGLPRLATRCGVPVTRALWLALANPLLLLQGVAGAHNDLLMVGLLVAGLAVAAVRPVPSYGRLAGAAAVVALAMLVKAPAGLALAFLPLLGRPAWPQRLRAGLAVAGGALACTLVTTTASGLGWGWLGTLGAGRELLAMFSLTTGLGLAVSALLSWTGLAAPRSALDTVLAAGDALLALTCLGLWLRAAALGPLRAAGLALLAVSLLAPVVQPWYPLWGLVVLAATDPGRRLSAALAGVTAALCLLVLPSGRGVVHVPLYGVPAVLALLGAGLAVHLSRRTPTALPA